MTEITTGSPKQIKWAQDIKRQLIRNFDKALESRTEHGQLNRDHPTVQRQERQIRRWLESKTDASWWIDKCLTDYGEPPIWPDVWQWLNRYLDEIKQTPDDQ